jgi:hypothetical protein
MGVTLRFDVAYDPESLTQAAEIIAALRNRCSPGIDLTAGFATRPGLLALPWGRPQEIVNGAAATTPGPGFVEQNGERPGAIVGPAGDDSPTGLERPAPGPAAATANDICDSAGRVGAWLSRLGAGSRTFWRLAAGYAVDHAGFTFEDLEAASGIGRDTLRSRYRNSYRAIRGAKAPDPMPGHRDPETNLHVYSMSPEVREKILELTADGGRFEGGGHPRERLN